MSSSYGRHTRTQHGCAQGRYPWCAHVQWLPYVFPHHVIVVGFTKRYSHRSYLCCRNWRNTDFFLEEKSHFIIPKFWLSWQPRSTIFCLESFFTGWYRKSRANIFFFFFFLEKVWMWLLEQLLCVQDDSRKEHIAHYMYAGKQAVVLGLFCAAWDELEWVKTTFEVNLLKCNKLTWVLGYLFGDVLVQEMQSDLSLFLYR